MYSVIIVDTFNMYFGRKKGNSTADAINIINYIETDVKRHLEPNGKLILLFDPIPKVNLQEKYFKTYAARAEISPNYKANRKKNPKDIDALSLIYQYFDSREGCYIAKDSTLEADDFVEGLVAKFPTESIALVTTDMDWARFLSGERVVIVQTPRTKKSEVVIHGIDWDNPFTEASYKEKHGYRPTIASVTLHKALFGDDSDNISGALCEPKPITKGDTKRKKIKFFTPDLKELAKTWVSDVAESGESLKDVLARIKTYNWTNLLEAPQTAEKRVVSAMEVADTQKTVTLPISTFTNNVRLIQTRCKDVNLYIRKTSEQKSVKAYIDNILGYKAVKPLTFLSPVSIIKKRLRMEKINKATFMSYLHDGKTHAVLITTENCPKCKKIKEDYAADVIQTSPVDVLVADEKTDKEKTSEFTDWLLEKDVNNVPCLVIIKDEKADTYGLSEYADLQMVLEKELE